MDLRAFSSSFKFTSSGNTQAFEISHASDVYLPSLTTISSVVYDTGVLSAFQTSPEEEDGIGGGNVEIAKAEEEVERSR